MKLQQEKYEEAIRPLGPPKLWKAGKKPSSPKELEEFYERKWLHTHAHMDNINWT